ncbi:MAG: type II toxin-antitoxin system VapC family toxin [Caulobacterales bacterium]
MVKALFDTNILIDYLNGAAAARAEFARYAEPAISVISWMEVMVGADEAAAPATRRFLARFEVIGLDQGVAEAAVALRRTHRIKLPDAIVWASAATGSRLLVTRNTKDFPADDPGVRFPYVI